MKMLSAIIFFISIQGIVLSADLPCAARPGHTGQGQICVCNSTYCDTIERPTRLDKGNFHLYTTSNSTPGFTHTTGVFTSVSKLSEDFDVQFSIDNTVQFQEIIGVGGSFSDSAGINIYNLPKAAQDKLIESYFGTSGVEYTLCRTPIGGSDFSGRPYYTLDDVPYDADLKHFSLTTEDAILKIPYIKKAMEVSQRGIKLYGCPWNSPQWMKYSYTRPNGGAGYIRSDYRDSWAKYFIMFIQAYKEHGIDIWGVSGGNEVVIGFMVGLNTTIQLADWQRTWLKENLVPQLIAANLSHVKFLGMDDMRMFISYWADRFAEDPIASKYSAGIALHWYMDFFIPPLILDEVHQKHPNQMIIYTESSINPFFFSGPGDPPVLFGSWGRAALYMHNIIENLSHWANGYIDWNLVLNTAGGPYLYLPLDAPIISNETSGEFYKQPMFYALGHFSKFIPPGSRRVQVSTNQIQILNYLHNENDLSNIIEQHNSYRMEKEHRPKVNISHPVTAPEIVECVATANSDGSNSIIILNNKNVSTTVKLEIAQLGSVTLILEEKSLNTLVYWME